MADDKPISGPAAPPAESTPEPVTRAKTPTTSVTPATRRLLPDVARQLGLPTPTPESTYAALLPEDAGLKLFLDGPVLMRPLPSLPTREPGYEGLSPELYAAVRPKATEPLVDLNDWTKPPREPGEPEGKSWEEWVNESPSPDMDLTDWGRHEFWRLRRERAIHAARMAMLIDLDPLLLRVVFPEDIVAAADARITSQESARWDATERERIAALVNWAIGATVGPIEALYRAKANADKRALTSEEQAIVKAEKAAQRQPPATQEEVDATDRIVGLLETWTMRPRDATGRPTGQPSLRDLLIHRARSLMTERSYGALEDMQRANQHAAEQVLAVDAFALTLVLLPLAHQAAYILAQSGVPITTAEILVNFAMWEGISLGHSAMNRALEERPRVSGATMRRWQVESSLLDVAVNLLFALPAHWSLGLIVPVIAAFLEPEMPTEAEPAPPVALTVGDLRRLPGPTPIYLDGERIGTVYPWGRSNLPDSAPSGYEMYNGALRPVEQHPVDEATFGLISALGLR